MEQGPQLEFSVRLGLRQMRCPLIKQAPSADHIPDSEPRGTATEDGGGTAIGVQRVRAVHLTNRQLETATQFATHSFVNRL